MAKSLQGKRIAMLVTDGVHEVEHEKPRSRNRRARVPRPKKSATRDRARATIW